MANEGQDALELERRATGFEIQVLMEEYKANRTEIQQRLNFQNQITSVGIAFVSGVIAAVAGLLKESHWQQEYGWVLISLSAVSSLLGLVIVVNDEMIVDLAVYQETVLKPRITRICMKEVLIWHKFKHAPETLKRLRIAKRLTCLFPHGIFVLSGGLSWGLAYYLSRLPDFAPFGIEQWVCFLGALVFYSWFILSAVLTSNKYKIVVSREHRERDWIGR